MPVVCRDTSDSCTALSSVEGDFNSSLRAISETLGVISVGRAHELSAERDGAGRHECMQRYADEERKCTRTALEHQAAIEAFPPHIEKPTCSPTSWQKLYGNFVS